MSLSTEKKTVTLPEPRSRTSRWLGLVLFLLLTQTGTAVAQLKNEEGALYDFRSNLTTLVVRDTRTSTITVKVLPQDEVWMLSARDSHLAPCDLSRIEVSRLVDTNWSPESLATLTTAHSADRSKATLIYIHGNRTDEEWAVARGLQFYQNTFVEHDPCDRPPVRFVIVSWRSEQGQCRPSSDYILKSKRAVVIGETIARVLAQFEDRQIVLAGFSLGCQVLLSALDRPYTQSVEVSSDLTVQPTVSGQYRVALIAPAVDGCFVASQQRLHPDRSAVARAAIFDNHSDRALRVSNFVRRRQNPIGDVPLSQLANCGNLPLSNISLHDVASTVGKGHSVGHYTGNHLICDTLKQMLTEVYQSSMMEIAPPLSPVSFEP